MITELVSFAIGVLIGLVVGAKNAGSVSDMVDRLESKIDTIRDKVEPPGDIKNHDPDGRVSDSSRPRPMGRD